jgi:hypothetical protein
MCHLIYFSTDSDEDFLNAPTEHFRIENPAGCSEIEEIEEFLAHKNIWYMGCRFGGCSCHFRHGLEGYQPVLGPHEDWMSEEDEEDNLATLGAYQFFKEIVASGHKLDVLSVWENEIPATATDLNVSVAKLPPEHFRFVQDVRFIFGP